MRKDERGVATNKECNEYPSGYAKQNIWVTNDLCNMAKKCDKKSCQHNKKQDKKSLR